MIFLISALEKTKKIGLLQKGKSDKLKMSTFRPISKCLSYAIKKIFWEFKNAK